MERKGKEGGTEAQPVSKLHGGEAGERASECSIAATATARRLLELAS